MLNYYSEYHTLPELLVPEDFEMYKKLCNELFEIHKEEFKDGENAFKKINDLDQKLMKNISYYAQTLVAPSSSFYGGIIAQEIVKFTGKYTPLCQWMLYENFSTCLVEDVPEDEKQIDNNSRYRDQICLFGKSLQEKLSSCNYFMVGAGALGCELLKQGALMGLACDNKNGKLTVTDDDTIEISNLNRQFLFRKQHVGKSKCEIACNVAKDINPTLEMDPIKSRVSTENEHIFTDKFFDEVDFVISAVDNIHARNYLDSKCLFHKKSLFDSGTLGTKCNSQCIVPYQTQSYGDSQDPAETGVPMCTIRHYPYLIDHCIEWARATVFESFFTEGSNEFLKFMENPAKYYQGLLNDPNINEQEKYDKLTTVEKYYNIFKKGTNIQSFVDIGGQLFADMFYFDIAQLLHSFPADYIDKEGRLFWTSPKRPPSEIAFDSNDELHMQFIESVVTILKSVFNMKKDISMSELKKMAEKTVVVEPPKKGKNEVDKEGNMINNNDEDISKKIEGLNYLQLVKAEKKDTFQAV